MQLNKLAKILRGRAWELLNNLRHPHPRPRRALLFSDNVTEEGIKIRWQDASSETQTLTHSLPDLNVGSLAFFPSFVLSLHSGSVVGKRGDVISAQGTIFTNISPEIPRRPNHHFLLERGNLPAPQYVEGTVAVLNCGPYRNYFHFLFDAISRLYLYQQANVKIDRYCVANHTRFQQELLTLFGIRDEQVIPLGKGTHVMAQNLIVSTLPGYNRVDAQVHLKDQSTYHFVRRWVLDRLPKTDGHQASHIYIRRRGNRSLVNEEEVLKALPASQAWETVHPEDYTVLEQAAIFHHARVIIAVHGAGLANLVYAQENTQVIELFNPALIEPIYFQMATLLNLRYCPVVGEAGDGRTPDSPTPDSVWVDPQKVRACLEAEQRSAD